MGKFNLLAAALLVVPSPTLAAVSDAPNPNNGNGLLSLCEDSSQYGVGLCEGYILGANFALLSFFSYCAPPTVTNGQVLDIVKVGLRNHPEERHKDSSVLIHKYLKAAFPCASTSK